MMRLRRLATCYVAIIVGSALVVVVEPLVAEKSHTSVVQGGMKYELMKRTRTTKSRESSSLLSSTNCASSFLKVRKSRDVEEDITLVSSSRRAVLGVAVSTGLMCWGRINLQPAKANDNDDDVIGIRQPSSTTATAVAMTTTVLADAATTPAAPTVAAVEWKVIFQKASQKAWSGGRAGASAAVVQVSSLMWLRTSMNYQYRYGGNLQSSLQTLWN